MSSSDGATTERGERIVIEIRESESAHSFTDDCGFIQQKAYARVCEIIKEDIAGPLKNFRDGLEKERCHKDRSAHNRVHNSIFIDGERGSGKTSFLLTALQRLPQKFAESGTKISSLGCIDPTLITAKNNFFILVIARIKKLIDARFREHLPADGTCEREGCYQEWNESLKKLANGLCMLEQVGNGGPLAKDEWADAQYIMRKGLEDADGGLELETHFHRFVSNSLKYLGQDVFILGIDDIDTDFQNGIAVLEVLRKYLTTPQISICIAGDFNLLRNLLQRQYYETIATGNFIRFKDKKALKELVENLTSQYLKKILPPRRRILLNEIYELRKSIYIKKPDVHSAAYQHYNQQCRNVLEIIDDDVPLTQFFAALVSCWYRLPHEICRYMGEYFFRLPLRTLISLLSSLFDKEKGFSLTMGVAYRWNKNDPKYEKLNNLLPQVSIDDNEFFDILSQIVFAQQEEIIDLGFDTNEFNSLFENFNMHKLGRIMYENNLLTQPSPLIPFDVSSMHANRLFNLYPLVYGACIAELKNIFEYFIRILILRDIMSTYKDMHDEISKIIDMYYAKNSLSSEVCDKFLSLVITKDKKYIENDGRNHGYINDILIKCEKIGDADNGHLLNCIENIICITIKKDDPSDEGHTYFSKYHFFLFLLLVSGAPGGLAYALEQMNYKKTYIIDPHTEGCKLVIEQNYTQIGSNHDILDKLKSIDEQISTYSVKNIDTDAATQGIRWKTMLPAYILSEIYTKFIKCKIELQEGKNFSDILDTTIDIFLNILNEKYEYKIEKYKLNINYIDTITSQKIIYLYKIFSNVFDIIKSITTPNEQKETTNTSNEHDTHDTQQ